MVDSRSRDWIAASPASFLRTQAAGMVEDGAAPVAKASAFTATRICSQGRVAEIPVLDASPSRSLPRLGVPIERERHL